MDNHPPYAGGLVDSPFKGRLWHNCHLPSYVIFFCKLEYCSLGLIWSCLTVSLKPFLLSSLNQKTNPLYTEALWFFSIELLVLRIDPLYQYLLNFSVGRILFWTVPFRPFFYVNWFRFIFKNCSVCLWIFIQAGYVADCPFNQYFLRVLHWIDFMPDYPFKNRPLHSIG